jgi:hypothetical protein
VREAEIVVVAGGGHADILLRPAAGATHSEGDE